MADWARGLLGGVAGLGKSMADIGEEQSKYRMEDLKAKSLYDRETNLANLKSKSAMDVAKFKTGEATELAKLQSGLRTGERKAQNITIREEEKRKKMEKGRAIASQVVPDFDKMGEEEQTEAIGRVLNQLEASTVLGGEAPSNKDINDATKNANATWDLMSEDERDAFADRNNTSVNEARGKYVENAVSKLRGKKGWDYTKTTTEAQLSNLKHEIKMADNVASAGSREEAMKLYEKELAIPNSPKGVASKLLSIIDDMYPESKVDKPKSKFASTPAPARGVTSEFLKPTPAGDIGELIRGTTAGTAITAPLKGLLGQGLETGA